MPYHVFITGDSWRGYGMCLGCVMLPLDQSVRALMRLPSSISITACETAIPRRPGRCVSCLKVPLIALAPVLHTLTSPAGCSSVGSLDSSMGVKRWKILCRKLSSWVPLCKMGASLPEAVWESTPHREEGKWPRGEGEVVYPKTLNVQNRNAQGNNTDIQKISKETC